jgi:hypothetical protein
MMSVATDTRNYRRLRRVSFLFAGKLGAQLTALADIPMPTDSVSFTSCCCGLDVEPKQVPACAK